jgi:hypothetical protein
MKKNSILLIILSILLLISLSIMILGYFRGKELVNVIKDLEKNNSITLNEKNSLSIQFERCKQDNQSLMIELSTLKENYQYLNSKLALLQEDISKIYKSCMTLDACKGKTPNIRWYCNNMGDEAENPTHICVCDSSCKLKISKI